MDGGVALMEDQERIGLFDMDGSLADYEGALRLGLESLHSPTEAPLPDNVWELEHTPHIGARMRLLKSQPRWWFNLLPIPAGFTVLEMAKEIGYQIHILTKGPRSHPTAWSEKVEWCQKHLPSNVGVHVTSDKGMMYGTFLYDDYPDYCERWLKHRPRGLVILPDSPYNRNFEHPQVVRWTGENVNEVRHALLVAYQRQARENLNLPGK